MTDTKMIYPIPPITYQPDEQHQDVLIEGVLGLPTEDVEGAVGTCCDHSSANKRDVKAFKKALAALGIEEGVMHDSCHGLMNHLHSGEEYRWMGGRVEQFDRAAYVWNVL